MFLGFDINSSRYSNPLACQQLAELCSTSSVIGFERKGFVLCFIDFCRSGLDSGTEEDCCGGFGLEL